MKDRKPIIHGRDHAPGGADPIPGLIVDFEGFIRFVTRPQDGAWLYIETTGAMSPEGLGFYLLVRDHDARIEVEQTLWEVVSQLNIAASDGVLMQAATDILVQAPSTQFSQGEVVVMLPDGYDFRVQDAGAQTILRITGPRSSSAIQVYSQVNMNGAKIAGLGTPTNPGDAVTKAYADAAGGAVSSVFGRTGAVVAVNGDYAGILAAFLTGATQAARFVGGTTSGAPVSGTFAVGDFVIAQDGAVWVCTGAGSPGTWVGVGGGAFATPTISLGSAAAAGAATSTIRSDATIAAFDTTPPTTQAFGDAAAVGSAAFAARRDHKHAMPATPVTSLAKSGSSALTGAVTLSEGGNVTLTQSGNDIAVQALGVTSGLSALPKYVFAR